MGVCLSEVKDDSSDCLGIDPTQHAVLMLQTQHDGGGHVLRQQRAGVRRRCPKLLLTNRPAPRKCC